MVVVGFFSATTIFSCQSLSQKDNTDYIVDTLDFSIPVDLLGIPNQWLVSDLQVDDLGRVLLQNINGDERSLDRYFIRDSKLNRIEFDSTVWELIDSSNYTNLQFIDTNRLAFLDMEVDQWKPQTGMLYVLDVRNDTFEMIEANGNYEGHSFSTISVGKTPLLVHGQSLIAHSPISDISVSDSVLRPNYGKYPMELMIGLEDREKMERVGCQWPEYWNEPRPDPFPIRCLENEEFLTSIQPFSFTLKKYRFEDGSCSEFKIRSEYVSEFEKYPESKQGNTYYLRKYLDRAPAVKNIAFDKFKSLYYIAIKHAEGNANRTAWSILVTDIDMNPLEEIAFSESETVNWKWLLPTDNGLLLVDTESFRGQLSNTVRFLRVNFNRAN